MSDEGCPFMQPAPLGSEQRTPEKKQPSSKDNTPTKPGHSPVAQSILGFPTFERKFFEVKPSVDPTDPCHYSSYLGIEHLLQLQEGPAGSKPEGKGMMHHEELTFIIVHQTFELWFRLVIADLGEALKYMSDIRSVDEVTGHQRVAMCIHYLRRTCKILEHSVGGFAVMETMHPSDFLEFRDFLVPASGFQSVQFRQLEQVLGIPREVRAKVNGSEVFTYLKEHEQTKLAEESKEMNLNDFVTEIFAHVDVPESFVEVYIKTAEKVLREQQFVIAGAKEGDDRAEKLIQAGIDNIRNMIENPVECSDGLFLKTPEEHEKFKKAVIGALFVNSYRRESRFALLGSLADELIGVEEGVVLFRGRHLAMAERMIGRRSGTGGTGSGVGYLDVTRRYRVFHCLWLVRKLQIRSSALPHLETFGLKGKPVFIDG